ncbi:acetate/propionate family kinase [Halanaerobium hydrogeniformans]|nr:acetate kinase [Halanaerobium hydrogeniformans]
MNIFVLNCGSSSLKFQLINIENEEVIANGLVEKISESISDFKYYTKNKVELEIKMEIPDHKNAIQLVLERLISSEHGVINDFDDIDIVGHRVVHAGEKFSGSVLITKEVINALKENIKLAPLHNPANIVGIEASKKLMPNTPDVGIFDTAFHQSMPKESYLYALPYQWYQENGVRRYGFHGTSHKYVTERGAELLKKDYDSLKIISCHLGNGASIAAVDQGRVIDTSMGFTPLEGLVMGTRPGDFDPGIISYIMQERNLSIEEIDEILNKESGVLALSGISNDFREISEAAEAGNDRAQLALDIFCRRVKKYIGAYAALLGGVDLLIFTAGIGENAVNIRAKILAELEYFGIIIDPEKNNIQGKEAKISAKTSIVDVYVIPTNEELVIAREAKKVIEQEIETIIKDILK